MEEARLARLIRALEDPKVSVQWNVSRELARMGREAEPALPKLRLIAEGADPTAALWARYAIAEITGDVQSQLQAMIAALGDRRVFPGMAATALAGVGSAAAPATSKLIAELESDRPDDRWSAAWALGSMPDHAHSAIPALTRALRAGDEKERWYAAWALGEIGPPAAAALPALLDSLDDVDDDVRGYAVRAIGAIGCPDVEAIRRMEALLADDNDAVRDLAREALQHIRGA